MAKQKNTKYRIVKPLLESGSVSSLKEVVGLIGITQFIKDTGKNYSTLHARLYKPENLKISDCIIIAELLSISPEQVMTLALTDIHKQVKKK